MKAVKGKRSPLERDAARLARAKALSPVFNLAEGFQPAHLILHGERDWLKAEPKQFFQALQSAGRDTAYISYPKAKHAFIVVGYTATEKEITRALLDIDAFLLERGLLEGPTSICMPAEQ